MAVRQSTRSASGPQPPDYFNFEEFSHGDFVEAFTQTLSAETLTRVLYPDDSGFMGQGLRLMQEYFLVACSLADAEVIPFHSTFVLDSRNQTVEAMIGIRISHRRGVDQPAGLPEQPALEEIENQPHGLGITRR